MLSKLYKAVVIYFLWETVIITLRELDNTFSTSAITL